VQKRLQVTLGEYPPNQNAPSRICCRARCPYDCTADNARQRVRRDACSGIRVQAVCESQETARKTVESARRREIEPRSVLLRSLRTSATDTDYEALTCDSTASPTTIVHPFSNLDACHTLLRLLLVRCFGRYVHRAWVVRIRVVLDMR
jgi:hypothetical protein